MLDGLKDEVDFFEIFGIAKPLKCSQWQLPMVKSNHEMKTDLELLITAFADFKKHILEVFATLIETNQSNDLRDTKYLHNIITNLQNVSKSKDQIVNHLGNDLKTLKDQLSVNESNIEIHGNTWKPVGSISHKNHIHKTQAENSYWDIKTFNRFTPLAPDIHKPNKDDTTESNVDNITNSSITNNRNNASETKRWKKSRKVSDYVTTPYFVSRQQQQQHQQNRLFFNNYPKNDMRYKKVLPVNTFYCDITQSGRKAHIFGTSMVSKKMLKQKKASTINSKELLHLFKTLEVPP